MTSILAAFDPATWRMSGSVPLEVVLRSDRPLRLDRADGRHIRCVAGCVWITAPGVRDDIYLQRGESWQIAGNRAVLVEAVGSAVVTLEN